MRTVQIPDELYEKAKELADADNVSVSKVVASALSAKFEDWSRLRARAERGSMEKFQSVMAKVGDSQPEPEDRL